MAGRLNVTLLVARQKPTNPRKWKPKIPTKISWSDADAWWHWFGSRAVPHQQRSAGARLGAEEHTIITIYGSPFPQLPSSSDKYSVVAIRWLHQGSDCTHRHHDARRNLKSTSPVCAGSGRNHANPRRFRLRLNSMGFARWNRRLKDGSG